MADYCELCDLPLSNCVHGMPPAPPPPGPAPRSAPRSAAKRAATPEAAGSSTTTKSPARKAPQRLTPPEALRPHILGVLEEAGGSLDVDQVYERLEARLADTLLERDLTATPGGELRWRLATRKARQSLIRDGLLAAGPREWRLS